MDKGKQDRAIKRATQGQVYTKQADGNVKFVEIDNMIIKTKKCDITLRTYFNEIDKRHNDLIEQYTALINSLQDAQFVFPDKQYIVVGLKNGYICKGNDYVVELTVELEEVYKGYCKIDNHKIVIDEQRKKLYLDTFKGGV